MEAGLIWFKVGNGSGLLWMWKCTFGFHKRQGILWQTD